MTSREIAEKYVYGTHESLTDKQEIEDMISDIENYAQTVLENNSIDGVVRQSEQLPICKCENTERIEVGSGSWNIHCKDCGKNW